MKTVVNRDGTFVRTLADGDNYVAKDGERLSVTMALMDGAPPQLHELDDPRRAYMQRTSEAWKNPAELKNLQHHVAPLPPGGDSHAHYEQRVSARWKDLA